MNTSTDTARHSTDSEQRADVNVTPASSGGSKIALLSTVPSTLLAFYQPLIKALVEAQHAVWVISSPDAELDRFEREGLVQVCRVPMERRPFPARDVRSLARLVRVIRRHRFDIMHTHTPKAGLLGMLAGSLARIPVRLHTVHGLPLMTATGWKRSLLRCTERITYRLAHRVLAVSPSLRDELHSLGLDRKRRVEVLENGTACGVDLARFTPIAEVREHGRTIRSRHDVRRDDICVGYVGWLVADKGVGELVQAFERVAAENDAVHLLMIGADGGDRDPLPSETLRLIREHPRIHYDGLVDDPLPYYTAMDLLVLPTRREGFGCVVIEAAVAGVPAIATRVTGCVDAVAEGETGILVPPGDTNALADAITTLANDASIRQRLGSAAKKRAIELFDSRRLVDAHLALYEQLRT